MISWAIFPQLISRIHDRDLTTQKARIFLLILDDRVLFVSVGENFISYFEIAHKEKSQLRLSRDFWSPSNICFDVCLLTFTKSQISAKWFQRHQGASLVRRLRWLQELHKKKISLKSPSLPQGFFSLSTSFDKATITNHREPQKRSNKGINVITAH